MKNKYEMSETVSIRVTKKRYQELKRIAKKNGHTISWLANFAFDRYFELEAEQEMLDARNAARKEAEAAQ